MLSCSLFSLTLGTILSKFPLRFSNLYTSLCCFVCCHSLITFLCTHHSFVVQSLHTTVGLFGNIICCNSLLINLISTFYSLTTCRTFCQSTQSICCTSRSFSHFLLCTCFRDSQCSKDVSLVNKVAFFHFNICDTAWELTSYTIFTYFYFSLYGFFCAVNGEITNNGHDNYYRNKAYYG